MSGFIGALRSARIPVVMEIKRTNADGENLLGGRSVRHVLAEYHDAGAPCVSVVTGRWFGGTESMLREVSAHTDLPILQKDFITRREQISRAKSLGASAVLLTAALLPRSSMRVLIDTCLSVDVAPFVEVTTEEEISAVPHAEQCVIAVNNKNIKVGERDTGDVDRSARLLPALLGSGTPCPVSASGINSPLIAATLLDAGYAGLLVGTALLRDGGVERYVEALTARVVPAPVAPEEGGP